jgi:hypothetical protein
MCDNRTPQEQFVSDFLMVAENDQVTYFNYARLVQKKGVLGASKKIQGDFEMWIESLATTELISRNEMGSLLLRQLLIGWGDDAFYQIAKRFEEEI